MSSHTTVSAWDSLAQQVVVVFVALYSELLIFGLNLVWGVAENNNTVSKYILFFSKVLTLCHPGGGGS